MGVKNGSHIIYYILVISLESVLHCQGGVEVESAGCTTSAPDEVVTQLKLCANAQFVVLTVLPEYVEPELRLGQEDKSFLLHAIGIKRGCVPVPQIGKTAEGTQSLCEIDTPDRCCLEAGVSIKTLSTEELLVQGLEGKGFAEVVIMPLPCGTY